MENAGVSRKWRTLRKGSQVDKRRKGPYKQGLACAKAWKYGKA